ncbi:origin recognition complex subunit 6 [Chaetomidium leptoderma]|uniref:Origin recognition complex subunit 6 n=1 Tax=Chaetomidium leptoderma TaxID=669021 RepID=A0AAN6ZZF1_9PEZI|nr:origin recognition complex subunit 6 [Chaetomidium leptoderma]
MNRSIEQALLSLLPTHNSTLAAPLTDLASSLLAQSRHRASTLKAEEEVARLYACAHLACDRLKTTLDLPPIDPRPPIPPRIYKRLYNHLDNILPATASTPSRATPGGTALGTSGRTRTPSSKLRDQQFLNNASPLANKTRGPASRTTPSKDKSLAQLRNPTATPSRKRTSSSSGKNDEHLPPWIRPALRFLLTHLGPARIGPVVASGLESIIVPDGKLTDDAWVQTNLVPVLGALYLFVWRGVTWPGGLEVDRERYVKFRKVVASCLAKARVEVELADGEEAGWEGWAEVGVREFDAAAVRGNRHGWFEMEWVGGVGDLVERERNEEDEGEDGDRGEEQVVQIRRADTMFQERYDYLGERKRKAYAEWKGGMLKRIKELEAR